MDLGQVWQFEVPAGLPAGTRWPVAGPVLLMAMAGAAQPWLLAALPLVLRRPAQAVQALRVHPDPQFWQARCAGNVWRPVHLRDAVRHQSHLALTLELHGDECVTNSKINCSVWPDTMAPHHWRRLNIVTGVGGCKVAYRKGVS
ncbi:hypothetical protein [Bordetella holmesii]|uniref:Putative N-acetyltransferase YedL n=1 Tax=Bordetella holmesii CDC-H585-BH TaxID=1331206 RepID=A0A158MB22_9BORD|nr:hypothetical protein [Bordetella holmesii]KCV00181.1 hypothetical protein L501_0137 [Bordetella holmesii CDC-H719-BH]AMD45876.1 hypothetical protein H558_10415 [Bordetella holmesii H558]AMD50550.1 hypothetical protein F783_007655 [Bordetella holmesii F627]AOB34763.1 hypothetical protein BBB42_04180 [Bordetella holmesii]AUL18767.1 hypothetical protein BTL46_04215 [Bordetella holmesii]